MKWIYYHSYILLRNYTSQTGFKTRQTGQTSKASSTSLILNSFYTVLLAWAHMSRKRGTTVHSPIGRIGTVGFCRSRTAAPGSWVFGGHRGSRVHSKNRWEEGWDPKRFQFRLSTGCFWSWSWAKISDDFFSSKTTEQGCWGYLT